MTLSKLSFVVCGTGPEFGSEFGPELTLAEQEELGCVARRRIGRGRTCIWSALVMFDTPLPLQ